ncbi:MAG: FkbM family methyltransferase, partial [Cytophagales bacterium]|nr:FkbM family methyltransferase [Cytophagales bacterium]
PHKAQKVVFAFSKWIVRSIVLKRPNNTEPNIVVIENFDADLYLKLDRSKIMGASIYWTGFHEYRELLFLHDFLKSDMVLLDIGANIGEYSIFAAKRLTQVKAVAFEPVPALRTMLEENIQLNQFTNVIVKPFGLSDEVGSFPIYFVGENENEGQATFFPGLLQNQRSVKAELKKLDDEWSHLSLDRLDFIKMDIEGSELKALQGGRATITRFRPLVMLEVSEVTYRAAGYSLEDVAEFFTALNYLPFVVNKMGKLVSSSTMPSFGNVIFVPQ